MKLHNTLTRKTEDFKPQQAQEVTLYTCGPTVYDYAHIGNLRAFLFYDTLRRTLEASDYKVRHVMNITDVGHLVSDADEGEDKLEKGAKREGKTVWDVATGYTQAFKADMKTLNILEPNVNPDRPKNRQYHDPYARATDFIDDQIEMVQKLIDKGFAYQTKQAIYFDVTKLPSYGELTGQKLTDKEVGARSDVVTDGDKHHPYDFAVWFFAVGRYADHSMKWASPWGEGFPGWHLECSAIIHATLDDPIDIHTGGIDHIGTHHPNEMAQTEATFGHKLAHYWVHNEFILVDSAKMSKSKGNFYTLKDISDHGFSPLAYRLLVLQAHYRSELNFTWESLEAGQNALLGLYAWADLIHQETPGQEPLPKAILDALADDLHTPQALAILSEYSQRHQPNKALLERLDQLFGLHLANRPDLTKTQYGLIEGRAHARTSKDWNTADNLRDQLREQGIELDDTPTGTRWRRTTT